jgi:hypothetical protein
MNREETFGLCMMGFVAFTVGYGLFDHKQPFTGRTCEKQGENLVPD